MRLRNRRGEPWPRVQVKASAIIPGTAVPRLQVCWLVRWYPKLALLQMDFAELPGEVDAISSDERRVPGVILGTYAGDRDALYEFPEFIGWDLHAATVSKANVQVCLGKGLY